MKIRTQTLATLKNSRQKFAALTSYDALTAQIFDEAGIEVILVGDSASNVALGNESTLPITLEEMITFGKAVAKAARNSLVVVDMPFGSYEHSVDEAVKNAVRIMKETGAAAVKLEGGSNRVEQIKAIIEVGIPVMGHVGFTPQTLHALGGYKVQGRGDAAYQVRNDFDSVAAAGVFAVVLEMIPAELAREISESSSVPTIGIGAGANTDGQILVWTDMVGLTSKPPSFSKQYLNLRQLLTQAAKDYRLEIQRQEFPSRETDFN